MSAEIFTSPRSITLTAVLTRTRRNGFTAEFKELPEFVTDGVDQEEALCNLIKALATDLTWKSAHKLHAAQGRTTSADTLELQIV